MNAASARPLPDPLDAVHLRALMERTAGRADLAIGLIDGPADLAHPDLKDASIASSSGRSCSSGPACEHGTFIAGMLFGRRGSRAPAIAPQCRPVLRPVLDPADRGHGVATSAAEVATAIRECLEQDVRLLHLSLAGTTLGAAGERDLRDAFDLATRRDALLVVAAGNEGRLGAMPLLDQRVVIPVAGCNARLQPARWSNHGPSIGRLGLMAPSEHILSTAPGGGYARMTGTSMAAPFVTGATALLWSLYPRASAQDVRRAVLQLPRRPRRRLIPPLLDAEASWRLLHRTHSSNPR